MSPVKTLPLQLLAKKLRDAKGMRNILAHQYGQVDDKIVFNATKEIETDVNDFIELLRIKWIS